MRLHIVKDQLPPREALALATPVGRRIRVDQALDWYFQLYENPNPDYPVHKLLGLGRMGGRTLSNLRRGSGGWNLNPIVRDALPLLVLVVKDLGSMVRKPTTVQIATEFTYELACRGRKWVEHQDVVKDMRHKCRKIWRLVNLSPDFPKIANSASREDNRSPEYAERVITLTITPTLTLTEPEPVTLTQTRHPNPSGVYAAARAKGQIDHCRHQQPIAGAG